jgi:hypothetical protein
MAGSSPHHGVGAVVVTPARGGLPAGATRKILTGQAVVGRPAPEASVRGLFAVVLTPATQAGSYDP